MAFKGKVLLLGFPRLGRGPSVTESPRASPGGAGQAGVDHEEAGGETW